MIIAERVFLTRVTQKRFETYFHFVEDFHQMKSSFSMKLSQKLEVSHQLNIIWSTMVHMIWTISYKVFVFYIDRSIGWNEYNAWFNTSLLHKQEDHFTPLQLHFFHFDKGKMFKNTHTPKLQKNFASDKLCQRRYSKVLSETLTLDFRLIVLIKQHELWSN